MNLHPSRTLSLLLLFLSITGCANYFIRKDCEKTNWYDHARGVAERGQWLEADPFLAQCRKVEAEINASQLDLGFKSGRSSYCSGENAYSIGRKGRLFSKELCDGPDLRILMSKHQTGTLDYCKKENSMEAGLSGLLYLNVCSAKAETEFLPGYRKGRIKFLETSVVDQEQKKIEKQGAIEVASRDLEGARIRQNHLEGQRLMLQNLRSRYAGNAAYQSEVSRYDSEISGVDNDLFAARSRTSSLESSVNAHKKDLENIRDSISKMKIEIETLKANLAK